MGLIDRAVRLLWSPEKRTSTPQWLVDLYSQGQVSSAGVNVTFDKALTMAAVWACVRVISETVGSLPFKVFKRRSDGGKEPSPAHPAYKLLHDSPNPYMTAMSVRETLTAYAVTRGNGYAELTRNGRGEVVSMWPLNADTVTPRFTDDKALVYDIGVGPTKVTLTADRVLHVPGLGFDGVAGKSVITVAREAIGLGLGAEQAGAELYGNGSTPGGVLEYPNTLSKEAQAELKKQWEAMHSGEGGRHRVAVLAEGMKWHATAIVPEDAQYIETRKFQAEEIARVFRVQPHKVGILDKATYSNIEQQSLEFVTDTIRPWLVRWEQEVNRKMFSGGTQGTHFAEHVVEGLLRGDIASRYKAFSIGRQWGWLNSNEIRLKENMNPIEGGDKYLSPLNMTTLDQAGEATGKTPGEPGSGAPEGDAEPDEGEAGRALLPVVSDAFARIVGREINATKRAVNKENPAEAVEKFYAGHAAHIESVLAPAAGVLGVADVRAFADTYVEEARAAVLRAMECGDLEELLSIWQAEKPQALAESLLEDVTNG